MNSGGIYSELLKREIPEGNPQTHLQNRQWRHWLTDPRRAEDQTVQHRVVVVCVILSTRRLSMFMSISHYRQWWQSSHPLDRSQWIHCRLFWLIIQKNCPMWEQVYNSWLSGLICDHLLELLLSCSSFSYRSHRSSILPEVPPVGFTLKAAFYFCHIVARLQLSEVALLQIGCMCVCWGGGLESGTAGSVCVCLSHHILLQEWGHNLLLCSRNLTHAGNCISFVHMTLRVGVMAHMCMYVCGASWRSFYQRSGETDNSWPFIDSF